MNFIGSCSDLELNERQLHNGVICEGKPNITQGLLFTNISISTTNKEFVYRKQLSKKEWRDRFWLILTGVILVLFISIFQDEIKFKSLKQGLWKKGIKPASIFLWREVVNLKDKFFIKGQNVKKEEEISQNKKTEIIT